jgi:hypothetical protein
MALAAATAAVTITTIASAIRCRLGLGRSLVAPICGAGRTVVGAVPRLITASVVCGRMLVSISVCADAEPSRAVPASALSDEESVTSAVPSPRQNARASSVSTRLHWGQRFIFGVLRPDAALLRAIRLQQRRMFDHKQKRQAAPKRRTRNPSLHYYGKRIRCLRSLLHRSLPIQNNCRRR